MTSTTRPTPEIAGHTIQTVTSTCDYADQFVSTSEPYNASYTVVNAQEYDYAGKVVYSYTPRAYEAKVHGVTNFVFYATHTVYDDQGRVALVEMPHTPGASGDARYVVNVYDEDGRLTQTTMPQDQSGTRSAPGREELGVLG